LEHTFNWTTRAIPEGLKEKNPGGSFTAVLWVKLLGCLFSCPIVFTDLIIVVGCGFALINFTVLYLRARVGYIVSDQNNARQSEAITAYIAQDGRHNTVGFEKWGHRGEKRNKELTF
jgi:hypothetical protein